MKRLLVALSLLSTAAYAENNGCFELARLNAIETARELKSDLTSINLVEALCSSNDKEESSIDITKGERLALQQLVCAKHSISGSTASKAHAKLRRLISRERQKEFESCKQLQKKGALISPEVSGDRSEIVKISISAKKGIRFQPIVSLPVGAFECSGPLMDRADSWPFDTKKDTFAICRRNLEIGKGEPAKLFVPTSMGDLALGFAPIFVPTQNENIDWDDILDNLPPPLPNIASCRAATQADETNRILTCSVRERWQECLAEMERGNVTDCKAVFPAQILPNVPEITLYPADGTYEKVLQGEFRARVEEGATALGSVSGRVTYRINFQTPSPQMRSEQVCDRSCPNGVCGATPCARTCAFADQVVESTAFFGPESVRGITEPSCSNAAAGSIVQTDLDRKRAYALCRHQNAWGRTIQGVFHAQVSKYYWIHDMRTTHWQNRGVRADGSVYWREIWSMIDPGERWRNVARLEIPVTIECVARR